MGGRQVGTLTAKQLETISSEPLGIHLRFEVLNQAGETAQTVHAEHPAARHIDISAQRRQHRYGPHGLDAFRRMLDGAAPFEHGGLGLRE